MAFWTKIRPEKFQIEIWFSFRTRETLPRPLCCEKDYLICQNIFKKHNLNCIIKQILLALNLSWKKDQIENIYPINLSWMAWTNNSIFRLCFSQLCRQKIGNLNKYVQFLMFSCIEGILWSFFSNYVYVQLLGFSAKSIFETWNLWEYISIVFW